MKRNTFALALVAALGTSAVGFAQNPIADAVQGAVGGAAQSLSQSTGQAVNNALGGSQAGAAVQGNAGINAGINQAQNNAGLNSGLNAGANLNSTLNSGVNNPGLNNPGFNNPRVNNPGGQSVVGDTVQGLINGQSFGTALQNSLDMNSNGYRLNGQVNSELQQQYGFRPGDVIVDQNGRPIRDTASYNQWAQSQSGYWVQRDGQVVQLGANGRVNGRVNNSGGVIGNTVQGLIGGQNFGTALRNSLDMNANGYRLNGQLNSELQQQYGFRPGDVIVDRNGRPIRDASGYDQWVQSSNGYWVLRDGEVVQLSLRGNYSNQTHADAGHQNKRRLGITMETTQNSAVVSHVDQNSAAARAGLRIGDRIVAYNDQPVAGPYNLMEYVSASNSDQANIVVDRNGQRETLLVRFDNRYSNTSNHSGTHSGAHDSNDYESLSQRMDRMEQALVQIQQSLNARGSINADINADVNADLNTTPNQ